MNELSSAHASLLAFVSAVGKAFKPEPTPEDPTPNEVVSVIDLDAVADEVSLPEEDFIGIQNFTLVSRSDRSPLAVTSAMVVVATKNDTNNMLLNERLNIIWDLLQPNQLLPLYDLESEQIAGDLKILGTTRLMPVARVKGLALQGITFQAGLQYSDSASVP